MSATTPEAPAVVNEPVAIRILDREFLIACSPDERAGLTEAASFLDGRMRDVRARAHGAALDRIAVLTALNLAHEMIALKRSGGEDSARLAQQLHALQSRLDAAVA
ncbi:MAG TPA: cell division protein ZapA [Rhodanobacteraceae bacterium]|nr:cell division protein ZapA [Rhodanobacteraceae bacterium]